MKRPSGFDRAREEPRPDRGRAEAAGDASAPHVGPRPHPLLRRRAAPRPADPAQGGARPGAAGPDAPDAIGGPDAAPPADAARVGAARTDAAPADPGPAGDAPADVAPTIDLGEVREARESGPAGDGSALGGAPGRAHGEPGAAAPGAVARRGSPPASALARLRAAREADPVRAAERRVREAGRLRRARQRRERRRFSAHARRRRRNWLIAAGAVAALALFVVAGAFTPLMGVRDIRVVGAESVDAAAVERALSRFDGVPLALVADGDVHRALEPFPLIQRYAVERVPPHTLTVRIEERVPVISFERDGAFQLFDAAGVLLGAAEAPPAGVPVGGGALSDRSSDAFRAAARVLRDMPAELRAQVASVSASSPQDVTLVLGSGVEVLWGEAEDTRRKAVVLTAMLGSLGDRPVEHIDVSSSEAPIFR